MLVQFAARIGWHTALAVCAAILTVIGGCGVKRPARAPSYAPRGYDTVPWGPAESDTVRWIRPQDRDDWAELSLWCAAVGPPLVIPDPSAAGPSSIDSLALVVWNLHVGGGDIRNLIRDLRSGKLSGGTPVRHFVLVVQEAFRSLRAVPNHVPDDARTAKRLRYDPPEGERIDIQILAEREGLSLFYVPSMRNGKPEDGGPNEDRGNATLATLPLAAPTAVELPMERQRRVAAMATVYGTTNHGHAWSIKIVNVHLDTRASWARIGRAFGVGRLLQTKALVRDVGLEPPIAIAGDFNTWAPRHWEPAINYMRRNFTFPLELPSKRTTNSPLFFPNRVVDYIFLNLPDGSYADYRVIDNYYGSDHLPLLCWVHFTR